MKIRIARLDQNQQQLQIVEVENELNVFQKIVDGNIERVSVTPKIDLWCNEEGLMRDDLELNALLVQRGRVFGYIKGNVYFASYDEEGNTTSLSMEQIRELQKRIKTAFMSNGDTPLAIHVA
ncbi:DUF3846 domain-containing protein [Bacillus pseudomycoides]|uniref:DUF3846 domain-containing protein n=1 Tax=Bacillus pseudomycoides TaxID=64104 RepID=UPI000BEC2A73|nr:DUF3846 domain-containing protein [Bacillus pseudomycoides]PEB42204.1 hypothetical protein COO06_07790 [Bacillus pseudomycoides]